MKKTQSSVALKVIAVVGFLCAVANLILSGLALMDVLRDVEVISHILQSVFMLSMGIISGKNNRKLAIVFYCLAGIEILFGISYLFM